MSLTIFLTNHTAVSLAMNLAFGLNYQITFFSVLNLLESSKFLSDFL